jgi:hypothetical protein
MAHQLSRLAPRLIAALVVVSALASGAIALAAAQGSPAPAVKPAPVAASRAMMRVPAVQGKAYVFAKGILEDAGFAWQVKGKVRGYAANVVVRQVPAAGTIVVDNGAPTLKLTLQRNTAYEQHGTPENSSPYTGSRVKLPGEKPARSFRGSKLPSKSRAAGRAPLLKAVADRHQGRPARKPAKVARKTAGSNEPAKAPATREPGSKTRPPAFVVPGAPKEPRREMPLPNRAKLLGAWFDSKPAYTDQNVSHWIYQHAWVVTGAKFGWWHGAEALEILIRADDKTIALWGIGAKSQAAARAALAEVRAKAKANGK